MQPNRDELVATSRVRTTAWSARISDGKKKGRSEFVSGGFCREYKKVPLIKLGAKTKRYKWPKQQLDRVVYLIKTNTPNFYYVGQTTMFRLRMLQHMGKEVGKYSGAQFTKTHGVTSFSVLCETSSAREADRREEFYTQQLQLENPTWTVSMGRPW